MPNMGLGLDGIESDRLRDLLVPRCDLEHDGGSYLYDEEGSKLSKTHMQSHCSVAAQFEKVKEFLVQVQCKHPNPVRKNAPP